jgi:hypothetical protein
MSELRVGLQTWLRVVRLVHELVSHRPSQEAFGRALAFGPRMAVPHLVMHVHPFLFALAREVGPEVAMLRDRLYHASRAVRSVCDDGNEQSFSFLTTLHTDLLGPVDRALTQKLAPVLGFLDRLLRRVGENLDLVPLVWPEAVGPVCAALEALLAHLKRRLPPLPGGGTFVCWLRAADGALVVAPHSSKPETAPAAYFLNGKLLSVKFPPKTTHAGQKGV